MADRQRKTRPARKQAQEPAQPPRPRRESGRARQRRQEAAAAAQSPLYHLKVEAAQALGVWEKVQREGWGALTAAESGRVGGYVTRCLKLGRQERDAAPGGL